MKQKNSKRIAVSTIAIVALLGFSSLFVGMSNAADPSATRSMPSSVGLGDTFDVTLTASNYGTFGEINETLPAGFTYVTSSLPSYQVTEWSGGVTFTLFGDTSFTYTVTAPSTEGSYTFAGILKDEDKNTHAVGGDDTTGVINKTMIEIISAPYGTVDYTNISFEWIVSNGADNILYSYKLEGYDGNWSLWTTSTNKTYNNLPDGTYTFKVRMKNQTGNDENMDLASAECSFTIKTKSDSTSGFEIIILLAAFMFVLIMRTDL